MNLEALKTICAENHCIYAENEPMSAHTSFHVGGACCAFVTVPTIAAFMQVHSFLQKQQMPFRVIGKGSNLLVPDEGYAGVVLVLNGGETDAVTVNAAEGTIACGAGASLKAVCRAALDASLTGMEFAYGIPGSVGGAVFMNAGAYDGETAQVLESVEILDENGVRRTLSAEALQLSYRHSIFMQQPDWVILRAVFRLQAGNAEEIRAKMEELLGRRKAKQPLEYPSAGSTFKRPQGSFASKLIDECGLRGDTVGGAQVSEKHAGFVVNRGGATFADIMALCDHVRKVVQEQTGYVLELEPEVLR